MEKIAIGITCVGSLIGQGVIKSIHASDLADRDGILPLILIWHHDVEILFEPHHDLNVFKTHGVTPYSHQSCQSVHRYQVPSVAPAENRINRNPESVPEASARRDS